MILVHVQDIVNGAPTDAPWPDVTAIPCEFMDNHENGHADLALCTAAGSAPASQATIGRSPDLRRQSDENSCRTRSSRTRIIPDLRPSMRRSDLTPTSLRTAAPRAFSPTLPVTQRVAI